MRRGSGGALGIPAGNFVADQALPYGPNLGLAPLFGRESTPHLWQLWRLEPMAHMARSIC